MREYHLDLRVDLKTMTWRRFTVLIRGLSGDSLWVQLAHSKSKMIHDSREAERAVDRFWK